VVDDMLGFIPRFPYPGDTNTDSIEWTGEVAKALYDYYQPDFMLLSYATPDFIKSSMKLTDEEESEISRRLFRSAADFLEHTGYTPVIIGTGGMSEVKEIIIPTELLGRISQGHGPFSCSGVFYPTAEEIEQIRNIPNVLMKSKDELRRDFPEAEEEYLAEMPDILLIRESGYAFSRARYRGMFQYKSPDVVDYLPIYTTLPTPSHITDVYRAINEALDLGDRIALIMLEGTGPGDFLLPYEKLSVKDRWMTYSDAFSQYMALLLGEPFYRFDIPLVREPRPFKARLNRYPYSQFTDGDMPQNAIGRRKDVKTAAVGCRSIYTHAVSQADICIECHARQMISSGILVLVNDPKQVCSQE